MPTKTPKTPAKQKGFDVAALLKKRAESVLYHIHLVRRTITDRAVENLRAPKVLDAAITAFGADFSVDLQTSSRYIADRVSDAMNAVPGRNYDFQLQRGRDDWQLECMRRDKPAKGRKKSFTGPGFDLDDVFAPLVRSMEEELDEYVNNVLTTVTNEALEYMPDTAQRFEIEVESTIPPPERCPLNNYNE